MSDILCLGEAMVEFNQSNPDGSFVMGFGGDTSNVAIAAARSGAQAGYITAVGADLFGDQLLGLWARENVDTRGVSRREDAPTGVYFVTHGHQGHEFTYLRKGSAASLMRPADLPRGLIEGAKFLHVSAISQAISATAAEMVLTAICMARGAGGRVCYDTNLRLRLWPLEQARGVIHEAMAQAHIARPSLEDARLLTGLEAPDAIADFYLKLGADTVALTMGGDGVLLATTQKRQRFQPLAVDFVDATGAGDSFSGAFLARLSAGDDAFAAACYANAAAALSTTRHGAVAGIPTAAEVELQFPGCII
jgi:2-dehydro-3-deoxygluconokinase